MLIITKLLLHIPGLDCLWWLLLAMLLPLLLGLLLGYWLWHQYKKRADELEAERDDLLAKLKAMETDFISLKYKYDELLKDNNALRSSLHSAEADIAILRGKLEKAAKPASTAIDYDDLFFSDNLQIVEGVGPKVEAVLQDAGILSWGMLAKKPAEELAEILAKAGSAFKMMEPKSWPRQAELAHEGKWGELVEYQKFLDEGREDKGDFETPSKVEQMALALMEALKVADVKPDDLKVIEGIGPKIEGLLNDKGIKTWAALAAKTTDELKAILEEAGERYRLADPSTWPRQAALAAAGSWDELKEYQEFLDGGKDPDSK